MNYTFGPVPSRRLGLSLGVDIVPLKTCSLSCRYCQVGETPKTTLTRREYSPVREIIEELKDRLKHGEKPDWLTFSGSGEPTLNSGIGEIIRSIKSKTDIPICVITNGTLLWDPQVRSDIIGADAVMPSLDSALEESFRLLCRPHPDLTIAKIIEGLIQFRKEYKGKIWLEILFVKGINDTEEELTALRDAARKIDPDSIQLNTVVRPPADSSAEPLSRERLEEIRAFFGDKAEVIASFKSASPPVAQAGINDVRDYLRRRPGSMEDISTALGLNKKDTEAMLDTLTATGEIVIREYFGKRFWEHKDYGRDHRNR